MSEPTGLAPSQSDSRTHQPAFTPLHPSMARRSMYVPHCGPTALKTPLCLCRRFMALAAVLGAAVGPPALQDRAGSSFPSNHLTAKTCPQSSTLFPWGRWHSAELSHHHPLLHQRPLGLTQQYKGPPHLRSARQMWVTLEQPMVLGSMRYWDVRTTALTPSSTGNLCSTEMETSRQAPRGRSVRQHLRTQRPRSVVPACPDLKVHSRRWGTPHSHG